MKPYSQKTYDRGHLRLGDWIVLLLALLICLGALGYYLYSRGETMESREVKCVFLISGAERALWEERGEELIREGDHLRSENGTVILGTVEKIERKEHLRATVRDGAPVWEAHPFLTDLEITVEMTVTEKAGDGIRAGDLRIAAGGTGNFRFGTYLARAEILELMEAEA